MQEVKGIDLTELKTNQFKENKHTKLKALDKIV